MAKVEAGLAASDLTVRGTATMTVAIERKSNTADFEQIMVQLKPVFR